MCFAACRSSHKPEVGREVSFDIRENLAGVCGRRKKVMRGLAFSTWLTLAFRVATCMSSAAVFLDTVCAGACLSLQTAHGGDKQRLTPSGCSSSHKPAVGREALLTIAACNSSHKPAVGREALMTLAACTSSHKPAVGREALMCFAACSSSHRPEVGREFSFDIRGLRQAEKGHAGFCCRCGGHESSTGYMVVTSLS